MTDGWIIVPHWDKFQHYSDRDPVWIKLYTELNSDDAWLDLSDSERGLLVTIWIEFARSRGVLKASRIPAKVGQKSRKGQLEALNQAGFIQVSASKPLALARSREKKESREEGARVPAREDSPSSKSKRRKPGATGWREVRGSHGLDYVPDPNGNARPPYSVPDLREMA